MSEQENAQEREETPQVVNLSQVSVEKIEAELVRATQSSAASVQAAEVEMSMSAVAALECQKFQAERSAVAAMESQQASLEMGAVGALSASKVDLHGQAGIVLADTVEADELAVCVTVARQVQAGNIRAGLVIGREIHGNVETLIDPRTALLASLLSGAVMGLILLAGRLLFGRRK